MKPAFDVKSARLDVLAIHLHTADLTELEEFLRQRTGQYQGLEIVPFVLDMQDFEHPESLDLAEVISLFARYGMQILGLRHDNEAWADYAARYHLVFSRGEKSDTPQPPQLQPADIQAVSTTVISNPTVLISTPVRTGQQVYAENGDLIVTGIVSQGAELIADGNIHIYAPMRGRALAGAKGDTNARIFIHSMQAELVSVAGIYRNFEQDLPEHLHKRAVQVSLQDNRLVISAIDTE
ncbi:septum site-determining protein MinC [Neisseria sp. N95_16]|uniref:Probable septum site-determining protein MinC n=1 Tax=Neisseria brasiliensis TaxID=2666100 RepID=A0A5Q3S297_9NEIS|nr:MULTISPECIES: septum site-determining protein MinC [Neisseria]MRN37976.1 septum site-determining protein MinC [Neisseria brasiliensis]PJO10832.1 septum site-determining protein MinC [Neisseria sp. N95_16]PJO78966.1 septum site-determining protein MinC [Neisseria sp. N177_16]QGL24918.1 septum site-determining protein MinC [Neisseria brasiliensis]